MEVIICILIFSIIISVSISKFSDISNIHNITNLKYQLGLIRLGISKQENKNILLNKSKTIYSLDDAPLNTSGNKLFDKVVDFKIISTDNFEKKAGSWVKISNNKYEYYLKSKRIVFVLESNLFNCLKNQNICKDIE